MKNFNKDAFLADVADICWEQGLKDTVDADILVTQLSPQFPLLLIRMLLFIQFGSPRYCPQIQSSIKSSLAKMQKKEILLKASWNFL